MLIATATARNSSHATGCTEYYYLFWSPFVGPRPHFQFLILYTVGRTPLSGDRLAAMHLSAHKTTHTDIQASSGIGNHDHNSRAGEDS
jgi:hypothetical protein